MSRSRRVYRISDLFAALLGRLGIRPGTADRTRPAGLREREAEWRWAVINDENRQRGCPCGKPAQVAKAHHEVVGSVPFLWWTCEEHAGAAMFSGRTAMYEHPAPCPDGEFYGGRGPTGGPLTSFTCPHRTHA